MASISDFGGYEFCGPQGALPSMPPHTAAYVPMELAEKAPGVTEIYAAAWSMAQRDHELDKLFNAEHYAR